MFNEFLEQLKNRLSEDSENTSVEMFFRDISQYKYISQKPVLVVQFRGADLENPPHSSFLEQRGLFQISFYYFTRTLENAHFDGVLEMFGKIRNLPNTTVQSLKAYSHRKNVSIWEIKTQIIQLV